MKKLNLKSHLAIYSAMRISVNAVSKSYDGVVYTPGPISFSLNRDSPVLVIDGCNGSGKTTLLRIILGEETATSGNVTVNERGQLTVLYQHDGLLPEVSAFTNIHIVSPDQSRTDRAIQRVGLRRDRLRVAAKRLSGGEDRRPYNLRGVWHWGRAYGCSDEPTSHADASFRETLTDVVTEHVTSGGLVILATHDDTFRMDLVPKLKGNAVPVCVTAQRANKGSEASSEHTAIQSRTSSESFGVVAPRTS